LKGPKISIWCVKIKFSCKYFLTFVIKTLVWIRFRIQQRLGPVPDSANKCLDPDAVYLNPKHWLKGMKLKLALWNAGLVTNLLLLLLLQLKVD